MAIRSARSADGWFASDDSSHAAVVYALDNELGIRQGRSWADFVLLTMLNKAGGSVPAVDAGD